MDCLAIKAGRLFCLFSEMGHQAGRSIYSGHAPGNVQLPAYHCGFIKRTIRNQRLPVRNGPLLLLTIPMGRKKKLVPVLVSRCELKGFFQTLTHIDLTQVATEEYALELMLRGIDLKRSVPVSNRLIFPGRQPAFPGRNLVKDSLKRCGRRARPFYRNCCPICPTGMNASFK